ncbi:MAG TPA: MDR family MFS transporter [Candidatus Dormibacteraeota bacterium]|nr:MDR family MFS transporter [Candidatus Dormibacteraeota bacterium]
MGLDPPISDRDRLPWTPRRVRITAGLMVALLVAAMDSSIVATALPTIGKELGGFSLYPWVIAGYLLTGTTTVPLWGRLADLHGRRRVLLIGMAVFVLGSLLCGAAPAMIWLVLFRSLQGIGAGCLQPVALTVVGDLFPLRQRARLQGLFSSVWAVAALAGPLLGALFVSTAGWRWIFEVNLPIGVVAAALLWPHRDHPRERMGDGVDVLGATLLTLGVGALLAGLGAGAGAHPLWPLVGGGIAASVGFVLVERGSTHPTVPLDLLGDRLIGPATAAAILAGALMFAQSAFVPLYVQAVQGGSAFAAGLVLTPASFGWTAGAVAAGRVLLRVGYHRLVVGGALSMLAGSLLLALVPAAAGPVWVGLASGLVGLGMGQLQTPLLIVLQGAVGWSRRGAVTALNQFSRTIGGAVGVSLLGMLLDWRVRAAAPARGLDPALLANPLQVGGPVAAQARPLLDQGLHLVFAALVLVSVATLAVALGILRLNRAGGAMPEGGSTDG